MPKNQSQRFMKFVKGIDDTDVKVEHHYEFELSKKYLKNKKLLNIGSWTGPFEILASAETKKITSVDIDAAPLKVLKKRMPYVNCVKASVHDLPLEDKSFDVVTMWAVIEHIPIGYELASLKELNRVLKKKGYLFLTTMDHNLLSNILDPAYYLVGHRHYKEKHLESMLKDAGFEKEQVVRNGSYVTAFHAWMFYFFKHVLRRKLPDKGWIENFFEKDYKRAGFYQIAIRARKL